MAKYGMSMCVLGMAEEFRDEGVAVNALWPRTGLFYYVLYNQSKLINSDIQNEKKLNCFSLIDFSNSIRNLAVSEYIFLLLISYIQYNMVKPNLKGSAVLLRFRDGFGFKKSKNKEKINSTLDISFGSSNRFGLNVFGYTVIYIEA